MCILVCSREGLESSDEEDEGEEAEGTGVGASSKAKHDLMLKAEVRRAFCLSAACCARSVRCFLPPASEVEVIESVPYVCGF